MLHIEVEKFYQPMLFDSLILLDSRQLYMLQLYSITFNVEIDLSLSIIT